MNELLLTRIVALVDIAMIGPAVIAVKRDWGSIITLFKIMLHSAIVAAAFVAGEQLHQITNQRLRHLMICKNLPLPFFEMTTARRCL